MATASSYVGEQSRQRPRRHALDTRRLAQRRGPYPVELLTRLGGQAADGQVVEVGRQLQVLVAAKGVRLARLPIPIAGVKGVDLDLLADGIRPR